MKQLFRNQLHIISLLSIMTLSFFLTFYNITQEGYANLYYSAAVQSMLESWQNFFFLSFDPAGVVTVDKPPLGFWIQTLFAKLLGYEGWVIILPQALAASLSVGLIYLLVAKWSGKTAGLISALLLALTPVAVATARNNTVDSLLVLVLLLATWALFRAVEKNQSKWLFLSAVLIGLGFNIKMLQAYMVLPAFLLFYLISARHTRVKKAVNSLIAAVLVLAVSFSWALTVDAVPADERPYIGSSQDNTVMELIFGHNGISRWAGGNKADDSNSLPDDTMKNNSNENLPPAPNERPSPSEGNGSPPERPQAGADGNASPPGQPQAGADGNRGPREQTAAPGGQNEIGSPGLFRLFDSQLVGQASWLLPFVLFALVALAKGIRRYKETSLSHHFTLFWLTWLIPAVTFFSFASFYHRYYLVMLAPAIAALAGSGWVAMWKEWQQRDSWRAWLLPSAVIVTATVHLAIVYQYEGVSTWLSPLILFATIISLVLLFYRSWHVRWKPKAVLILTVLALSIAPLYWSFTPMIYGGALLPYAGPELEYERNNQGGSNNEITDYLVSQYDEGEYLVLGQSSHEVSSFIIETGLPAVAYGGFNGGDQALTLTEIKELVATGKVEYVLLSDGGRNGSRGGNQEISQWLQANSERVELDSTPSAESNTDEANGARRQSSLYRITVTDK
ncbi:glycosyltransferase family 39 protein [Mechercharimyces sp. CAU 1602]|uniref:ArnT family glycosyltransferase n=1 Tax=Mechercharimyces sp. CAU 1602 TaxID=2973933 RepID=UPI00216354A5|nr:glycosyltransferase family 39 protein [Mechercharimyces sp. CAU 1602]MCS1352300.1 glycosyltransferase family 39 protein [Mechercharimyces sp. CAU 1602]